MADVIEPIVYRFHYESRLTMTVVFKDTEQVATAFTKIEQARKNGQPYSSFEGMRGIIDLRIDYVMAEVWEAP